MKFLDLNGLTSVLSKLLTKVSAAFDGLEERVTANETAIEGKADAGHSHEDVNELIKELYVNAYDGSESQLNMLIALSGGLSEVISGSQYKDFNAKVYICNNGDAYVVGNGEVIGDTYEEAGMVYKKNATKIYFLNGITIIGNSCLELCEQVTKVFIPNSVTQIKENFLDSSGITEITIPSSVTSIGSYSFAGCKSLTYVKLSEGLEEILNDPFRNCTALTEITIPSSVKSIGSSAFYGCTNLATITIDKPQDSITGQPWGATGAEVIWTGGE